MKKLILIITSVFIASQTFYSQINSHGKTTEQSRYWNMAFMGGAFFNVFDRVDSDNRSRAGYTGGFEMFYDMKDKKSAIVITALYGRNKRKNVNFSDNIKSYTEYYEITFGPRFYLGKQYFVETLFGDYILNYVSGIHEPIGLENNSSTLKGGAFMCFGIGAAAGKQFRLTEDLDAIIKGNLNFIVPGENMVLFGGLTTGIIFHNKKIIPEIEKLYSKNGKWSVTLTGGITNPELFRSEDYDLAGNIGIEGAYRSTPKFEVYGNLNYNEIKRKFYNSGRSMIDLTFGPRFILGNEKYSSFFELGIGLYMHDYLNAFYSNDDVPYLGINFGTGVIISINEHIGIPIKGKMHLVLNGTNRPGGYFSTSCGIRYVI